MGTVGTNARSGITRADLGFVWDRIFRGMSWLISTSEETMKVIRAGRMGCRKIDERRKNKKKGQHQAGERAKGVHCAAAVLVSVTSPHLMRCSDLLCVGEAYAVTDPVSSRLLVKSESAEGVTGFN